MAEILPRIGIVRLAAEKYCKTFRDYIVGIVGIGSFFNAQLERTPRDIDLVVVVPNQSLQHATSSSNLIQYQIHKITYGLGIITPIQVGIWPEMIDPTVGYFDPVLAESVINGLVLAGKAPQWRQS
jgi:hypothetical protein